MRSRSMARKFSGTVKEILGTAQSVGCTIDGMNPHDVIEKINDGEVECPVSSKIELPRVLWPKAYFLSLIVQFGK